MNNLIQIYSVVESMMLNMYFCYNFFELIHFLYDCKKTNLRCILKEKKGERASALASH